MSSPSPGAQAGAAGGPGRPRIYTRTGDDGTTGLLGPGRAYKDDPRVEAYGAVDELNAHLGWARCLCRQDSRLAAAECVLAAVQERLFVVGAELARAGGRSGMRQQGDGPPAGRLPRIGEADVAWLEQEIDRVEQKLPPLTHFVLPGGCPAAAALHVARAVARRAERRVVSLARQAGDVRGEVVAFLNRLSDLLFVLARQANWLSGCPEHPWHPPAPASGAPAGAGAGETPAGR
ncbi:MAG TPA: cob(I)yrinic acid a,c-diamide adenosyltransferase [Limnochordales bacterium]